MPDAQHPIEGVAYLTAGESARYRSGGAWLDSSAGDLLRSAAQRSPAKWALITQERRLTYADLDEATERLGAALLQARRWSRAHGELGLRTLTAENRS